MAHRVVPIEAGAQLKAGKPNDEGLISLRDVRRIFGVPMIWAREDADAGILPHVLRGQIYLFRLENVQEWLRSGAAFDPERQAVAHITQ